MLIADHLSIGYGYGIEEAVEAANLEWGTNYTQCKSISMLIY